MSQATLELAQIVLPNKTYLMRYWRIAQEAMYSQRRTNGCARRVEPAAISAVQRKKM